MRLGLKLKSKESKQNQEQQQELQAQEYKIDYVFTNNNEQQFNIDELKSFKYVIQKRNTKGQMIIAKDYVYVGETSSNKMVGIGKIYIQQCDAYCNNNYFVFEGEFKKDQIDGKGVEYYGKSNNKKVEGIFIKHSLIEKIQEYNIDGSIVVKQNLQQSQLQQSFIQDDRANNKMFRIKSAAKQQPTQHVSQAKQKQNDKWSKYDVELSKDHLSSLLSEKAINDQIIEAFINYLNYNDKEKFFTLKSQQEIQQYKRSLVLPFFLIEQQKMDILNTFSEYQYLNGQFWMIYQQIFAVVNQNGHWILVEINVEGQDLKMKIYDSQSKKKSIFYVATCKHVWQQIELIVKQYNLTLSWKSKDVSVIECPQLQQPNDDGIFVCAYLKYLIQNIPLEQITQEVINNLRKNELFNIVKKEK